MEEDRRVTLKAIPQYPSRCKIAAAAWQELAFRFNSTNNPNIKNRRLIFLGTVPRALKYERYKAG